MISTRLYHAMRMHSMDYAVRRCPYACPSVCPSCTRWYCVKTTKHQQTFHLPYHGNHNITTEPPPQWSVKCRGYETNYNIFEILVKNCKMGAKVTMESQ